MSNKDVAYLRKLEKRQRKFYYFIMPLGAIFLAALISEFYLIHRVVNSFGISLNDVILLLKLPDIKRTYNGYEVLLMYYLGNFLVYAGGLVLLLIISTVNFKKNKLLLKLWQSTKSKMQT